MEEQLLLLKVSLAAGTDSPSLTSAPLFFLTYLDSLFHTDLRQLGMGMGVSGQGLCGGLAGSAQV